MTLNLPPGNVTIRVHVCDMIKSCTNYVVSQIYVPFVYFSSNSSIAFSVDIVRTIKSGHVDKFLMVALSAATTIAAQSKSLIRNRRLTQVFVALKFDEC